MRISDWSSDVCSSDLVEFMPHVAPHFRGLTVTANLHLRESTTIDAVRARYADRSADEPLLRVDDEAPWVSRIAGRHGAERSDERRVGTELVSTCRYRWSQDH